MKDIENSKKESPFLGLTGMGGGVASLMWAAGGFGIWSWGRSSFGALGLNQGGNPGPSVSSPTQIGTETNWNTPIIVGSYVGSFQSALKNDGTLWTWGQNYIGALGLNEGEPGAKSSPVQVGTDTTWAGGCMGKSEQYMVKTDGTLWAWGEGGSGNLGLNNRNNISSPAQVGTNTTWSGAVGKLSSNGSPGGIVSAIKTDGSMWVWGKDEEGQLGLNSNGVNRSSPTLIPGTWNVCARGYDQAFAINSNNELYAWGRNDYGQLGLNVDLPTNISSPVQVGTDTTWSDIACIRSASFSIKTDGSLWSWGQNQNGRLGHNQGETAFKSSPTQVGTDTTWSSLSRGGSDTMGAIKTDGTLWVWGDDEYGQMGEDSDDDTNRSSPIQIPGNWSQVGSHNNGFFGIRKH